MYKSPIDKLISNIVTEEENAVMRAVVKCGINVDKDELVKALAYDRGQYEYRTVEYRKGCIRCKETWLERIFDTYPSKDGIWEIQDE